MKTAKPRPELSQPVTLTKPVKHETVSEEEKTFITSVTIAGFVGTVVLGASIFWGSSIPFPKIRQDKSSKLNFGDQSFMRLKAAWEIKVKSRNTSFAEKQVATGVLAEAALKAESLEFRRLYEPLKELQRSIEEARFAVASSGLSRAETKQRIDKIFQDVGLY